MPQSRRYQIVKDIEEVCSVDIIKAIQAIGVNQIIHCNLTEQWQATAKKVSQDKLISIDVNLATGEVQFGFER